MAKSKTYELMLKIAGKADSSLKAACREAANNLDEISEAAKTAGKITATGLTAAATAAATVAAAGVTAYTQHSKAANNLAATTGAAGKELANLQGAMETVYKNNFGEDIQDVADTVSVVNRNLKDLPKDQIVEAAEAAITLRDAFSYGTEETTRAAAAIEKNFGTSAEKAFSLIAAGAQNGLDYSGEMIDTINEYSSQFSKLGFTADGMFGLLQSGADSTAWNLDKVGDAIKEFSIRSIDGSKTTVAAFENLGYNAEAMMQTFAAGGEGANQAFFDVLDTLMSVDDSVKRDAMGVALFGTMWEDLGTEAMEAMANASTAAYDTKNALEQIKNVQYGDLGTSLQGVQRKVESILVKIGGKLAPYAQEGLEYISDTILPKVEAAVEEILPKVIDAAEWVWENREAIISIASAVASAVVAFKALKTAATVASTVKSLGTVFAASAKTGGALSTIVKLLGGKFTVVAAIIAALVGAGVWLYQNWDTVKAKAAELGAKINSVWAGVSGAVEAAISAISQRFPVLGAVLSGIWTSLQDAWVNIQGIFSNIIGFIDNVFSGNWSAAWENIVAIFGNVFGLIVNLAKAPINGVISAINWVLGKINSVSFSLPDWSILGDWAGRTLGFNLPTIPLLASGGIATAATLAMVGEGGEPEVIMPLSKLAALLDEWTNKPKPGGGGAALGGDGEQIVYSPVFNFYGPADRGDVEEATRVSFEEFKRLYRRMKTEERRKQFSPA